MAKKVTCRSCRGRGFTGHPDEPIECEDCRGTGKVCQKIFVARVLADDLNDLKKARDALADAVKSNVRSIKRRRQ